MNTFEKFRRGEWLPLTLSLPGGVDRAVEALRLGVPQKMSLLRPYSMPITHHDTPGTLIAGQGDRGWYVRGWEERGMYASGAPQITFGVLDYNPLECEKHDCSGICTCDDVQDDDYDSYCEPCSGECECTACEYGEYYCFRHDEEHETI